MAGAVTGRHCVFGIIGLAFLSGREGNAYPGGLRTVSTRKKSGDAAYGSEHMGVAHFCRDGSFREIFRIDRISARIVGADTRNGKLTGFAADLCGLHAVRNGEAGIT